MISYDSKTALVVVDLQNDFADPKGRLFVEGAESVVPRANIEIMRAQSAGSLIVYIQDSGPQPGWGAELHPGLQVSGQVLSQGTGALDIPTQLQTLLEERGIDRVVLLGVSLEGRVKATALQVAQKFTTVVVAEATATVDREQGDGRRPLEELRRAGVRID